MSACAALFAVLSTLCSPADAGAELERAELNGLSVSLVKIEAVLPKHSNRLPIVVRLHVLQVRLTKDGLDLSDHFGKGVALDLLKLGARVRHMATAALPWSNPSHRCTERK